LNPEVIPVSDLDLAEVVVVGRKTRVPAGATSALALCARRRGEMSYQETVREKIGSSMARQEERSDLWAEISKAYEQGGIEEVESGLTKKMEELSVEFRYLLGKLERML